MDLTCGDLVGGVYDTTEEAQEWINNQDIPSMYGILER